MKSKLSILMCAVVAISLFLLACSPASPAAVDVSYAWNQETEIAVGGSLTVTLESNVTTGFAWELVNITDETVLEQVGEQEYKAPEAGALIGAGGEEVWTFKALKKGTSTISMEYRRPWEKGVEPAQTFALTVVVK